VKSPHRPSTLPSVAALLTCLTLGACSSPQPPGPLPIETFPYDTGTVVATAGDTITVLMNQQLVKIRLEGFADEGTRVAAAVRRSPAHARFHGNTAVAKR